VSCTLTLLSLDNQVDLTMADIGELIQSKNTIRHKMIYIKWTFRA